MNLGQLIRKIIINKHRLKNLNKTKIFLKYHLEILRIKKNKLKLGAVGFELIDILISGIPVDQDIEMRFIRQDTTEEDSMKFENRLKALNWEWDFKNVGAFIIVSFIAFLFLYSYLYIWYCDNLPAFAFREEKYDNLVKNSINLLFIPNTRNFFKTLALINFLFIDVVISFCSQFNILF